MLVSNHALLTLLVNYDFNNYSSSMLGINIDNNETIIPVTCNKFPKLNMAHIIKIGNHNTATEAGPD